MWLEKLQQKYPSFPITGKDPAISILLSIIRGVIKGTISLQDATSSLMEVLEIPSQNNKATEILHSNSSHFNEKILSVLWIIGSQVFIIYLYIISFYFD